MSEEKIAQHLVGTSPSLVKCIMEIIESHHPDDWKELGLYVYADAETKSIYLEDFLLSEKKEAEAPCGTIYPCEFADREYGAENILVYFYTCITAIKSRLDYEDMRKEEDAKKERRDNDNELESSRRSRSKNTDDAERPLSDPRPRPSDSAGA